MDTKLDRLRKFSIAWWPLMLPVYVSVVGCLTYLMIIGGSMAFTRFLGLG